MTGDYEFKLLGATLDDAIGEAYDKVARIVGVPYPGGPNVERLAKNGNTCYDLAKPVNDNTLNFSYSGLKSNVINLVHNAKQRGEEININDLAASFQYVAVDEICRKIEIALKKNNYKQVVLAGGVSANNYLREEVRKIAEKYNCELAVPRMLYCTDNAAMIGAAAYPLFIQGKNIADFSLNAQSHVSTVE